MKFAQQYKIVMPGEIYPRTFEPGDECPPEIEANARAAGRLEAPKHEPKGKSAK